MTDERRGLSRRTVLTGAAWTVPVIAVAAATPMAAASTGRLTALFVIAGDVESDETQVAGAVFIRNTSNEPVTLGTNDITITLQSDEFTSVEPVFSSDAVADLGDESVAEGDNDLFSTAPISDDGTLVIFLVGEVTVAAGDELVIGFYFRRRQDNPAAYQFVIAGFVDIRYSSDLGVERSDLGDTSVAFDSLG